MSGLQKAAPKLSAILIITGSTHVLLHRPIQKVLKLIGPNIRRNFAANTKKTKPVVMVTGVSLLTGNENSYLKPFEIHNGNT